MPEFLPASFFALLILMSGPETVPNVLDYVGKYPFDKINGKKFVEHQIVAKAVNLAVQGSIVAPRVRDTDATSGIITKQDDLIVSWSCERHNCNNHQWAIVFSRSRQLASVCYYNSQLSDGARWFLKGDVIFISRFGDCQFDRVPDRVSFEIER